MVNGWYWPIAVRRGRPKPTHAGRWLFKDDWQERINTFLHTWLQERQLALNSLTRDHRREIV